MTTNHSTAPQSTDIPLVLDLDRAPVADLTDDLQRLEVEHAMAQLEGVEAARIVAGTNRPVDELHALVTVDREPKHVARDLQTLLLTRFGVEVDRRVISVVRLGERAVADLSLTMPRLELDCVNVAVRSSDTSVSVELLTPEGDTVLGSAGPLPGDAVVETTAAACADAIGSLVDGELRIVDARIVGMGAGQVAVVVIEVQGDRERVQLSGSAVVRRNQADCVARAVLDATNRLVRD